MNYERMQLWKERLSTNESAYSGELGKMDHREEMFRGKYKFKQLTARDDRLTGKDVQYVYNALAENIEAQVSADIPMPKVTARRPQDERLAVIIENMLRNELDRLPMENLNDLAERVVPLQGGGLFLLEWDNTRRSHATAGENALTFVHPKWCIPQNGVYDSIQSMDYVILKLPQTKEAIRARYGVDVDDESETEPDIKDAEGGSTADDMVTQYVAYYRNETGGIGKYSWCCDTELEDLEDYQARRLSRCAQCGAAEPMDGEIIADGDEEPWEWHDGDACPVCGGRDWTDAEEDFEEVEGPVYRTDGTAVPGTEEYSFEDRFAGSSNEEGSAALARPAGEGTLAPREEFLPKSAVSGKNDLTSFASADANSARPEVIMISTAGRTIKVPYYKPDMFPIVLQKNVSVFGRLLGESDADKMEPMQDGINRLEQKIFDRMLKAGTKISLPDDVPIRIDTNDQDVIRVGQRADLSLIRSFDFTGDVTQELRQIEQIYQHMRQTIGITDSYQGRKDSTATSGTAKEFAAAQAAGRMESKRTMKQRAYSELFELMFKFRLAYADEPRPVVYQDGHGETVYDTFSRWDFLETDEDGRFWWNDQFLFSCDVAAPLASNRERLWQETTSFFSSGAFGDPTQLETLVEYWTKMELLHYPGAGQTRKNLQERLDREREAAELQAAQAPEAAQVPAGGQEFDDTAVEEMARQAAMADIGAAQ